MLNKLLFTVAFVCLLNFFSIGQTTIPVSISMDTIRACQENIITAGFRGSGSNRIRINSHLFNVSNGISCGTSNGLLLEFISLKDSVGGSIPHSAIIIDTTNGGMSFNVSTTDTCVLTYKIRVDCSLIQTSNVNNQIYLVHHWADSSSSISYNLNGSAADSAVNFNVVYPIIQNITNLIDSVGYKEHVGLEFSFLNSGTDSGKIAFQLFTDTSNYCNALTQDSLRFKINANGVPASYVNGSFQNINLAVDDTLIVTQYVTSNTCLNDTCHPQVRSAWRCSYADAGFYNSLVNYLDELPLLNEDVMNEVEIAYEEGGIEGILSYREQISEIAFQCPYQGGPAVYRARYFLSLFNDSIEYDDAATCLSQGLSRQHAIYDIVNPPVLVVQPNPANNEIEVHVEGLDNSFYQLKTISQEGRILKGIKLQQQSSANRISTLDLAPGVYYLEAIIDQKNICRSKLVIVR